MFHDFITKYTDIFIEKMREAFALQKLLKFFQQKLWRIWDISIWNFNERLTNDVVSFEQLGPGLIDIFFVMLRLARWPPTWEMAIHMAATDDVFDSD